MMRSRIFLLCLMLLVSQLIFAADTQDMPQPTSSAMQRLADRLKMLTDSNSAVVEITSIGEADNKTVALFEAPDGGLHQGAVIVLLGLGQIIEKNEYSKALRKTLAASGWATLIVQTEQMDKPPESAVLAKLSQLFLKSAIEQVNAKGYSNIVVVAHGAIAQYIWPAVQASEKSVLGFVGIDEWLVEDFSPSLPVLNVVNNRLPRAINFANKRFSQLKKNPSAPCELFFYEGTLGGDVGYGDIVGKRIRGWIERHFANAS